MIDSFPPLPEGADSLSDAGMGQYDFMPGGVIYGAPTPKVLAMVAFKGKVIVAREDGVFILNEDMRLEKVEITK